MKQKTALLSLMIFIVGIFAVIIPYAAEISQEEQSKESIVSSAPASENDTQTKQSEETEIVYHGNIKSKKFHKPSCRYYDCKNCTKKFTTRKDAIEAGYVPCKVCKP